MDFFEERILAYLRENRSNSFTVYQLANVVGTGGAGFLLGRPGGNAASGYAVGVQMVRNALESLITQGLVSKRDQGTETYYSAR